MKNNITRIAVTVDLDFDNMDSSYDIKSTWHGLEKGVPLIVETIKDLSYENFDDANITWFVRVDYQVETLFGSSTYIFDEYPHFWDERASKGDEIAWHPHICALNNNKWITQTSDVDIEKLNLPKYYNNFCSFFKPNCVRIGEGFQSNYLIGEMAKLKIAADSTALPGRTRIDEDRNLNWDKTPQMPYKPSINDYRVPGNPDHDILEIPMSMIKTKASYDDIARLRYFNPAFKTESITDGIKEFIDNYDILVLITHPIEVLPVAKHGLLSFDINTFRNNICYILRLLEEKNRKVEFVTLSKLARSYPYGILG